jgi:hypothetical protein
MLSKGLLSDRMKGSAPRSLYQLFACFLTQLKQRHRTIQERDPGPLECRVSRFFSTWFANVLLRVVCELVTSGSQGRDQKASPRFEKNQPQEKAEEWLKQ